MQQIQINNKYLEFQNGIISYRSPTVEKVISYNKDDEKSFSSINANNQFN